MNPELQPRADVRCPLVEGRQRQPLGGTHRRCVVPGRGPGLQDPGGKMSFLKPWLWTLAAGPDLGAPGPAALGGAGVRLTGSRVPGTGQPPGTLPEAEDCPSVSVLGGSAGDLRGLGPHGATSFPLPSLPSCSQSPLLPGLRSSQPCDIIPRRVCPPWAPGSAPCPDTPRGLPPASYGTDAPIPETEVVGGKPFAPAKFLCFLPLETLNIS